MSVDFNIADVLKLPVKIFVAVGIGTGVILFLPDSVIQKLYLTSFRDSFGFVIGLIFIISVSIVGVTMIIAIYKMIRGKINFKKMKENREKFIASLDDYQKTIVYILYDKINHTDELPISDGSVRWLEQNSVLAKATSQHFIENPLNITFPYMLNPWVIEYLNSHSGLLEDMKKTSEKMQKKMKKQEELPDLGWY